MRPICTAAGFVDTVLGCRQEGLFVDKKLQVLQVCRHSCRQTVQYGIGIAGDIVRQ